MGDDEDTVFYPEEGPFEVLLSTYFEKTSGEDARLATSVQPQYSNTWLTIRLDLDAARIMSLGSLKSARERIGWAVNFLDELTLERGSFSLEISHDAIIPSDPFSLVLPTTSSFQSMGSALRMVGEYRGNTMRHSLSFSDLGLSEDVGFFIYSALAKLSDGRYELGAALVAATNQLDGSTLYYPEVQLGLGLADNLSLRISGITAFTSSGFAGYGIAAYMPYDRRDLELSLGLAYTDGAVQYGRYLNGYELYRPDGKRLTLFSSLLYQLGPVALVLDMQLPYNMESGGLSWGEDFFSAEFSTTLWGISLAGGIRLGGIISDAAEAFGKYSQSFVSLGYSNRAISTSLGLYFDRDMEPSIALSATMRGYQSLFARSGRLETSPHWLDITLYTGYSYGPDSSLMIRPTLAFNLPEDARIALRFPFNLSTEDGRLVLANGMSSFGIGGENTVETVYSFITDLFSLVERLELGGYGSPIYLIANRDGVQRPALLENYHSYGYDAGLGANLGFNIPSKASVNLFIDNLERPRIHDLTISMMPMGEIGPRITGEAVLDLLYSAEDWDAVLGAEFAMRQDFEGAGTSLTLWANSFLEFGPDHFDIHLTSRSDLEAACGLTVESLIGSHSIKLSGGMHSGRARASYYDEFSLRDAGGIDGIFDLEEPTGFLSLALGYEGEGFSVEGEYSIDSFPRLASGDEGADRLRLSAEVDMNDLRVIMLFIRKNFASSLGSVFTPGFWTSLDGVYELSLEKTFGHLGFRAAVYLASDTAQDERWLNGRTLVSQQTSLGFSLVTSLRF